MKYFPLLVMLLTLISCGGEKAADSETEAPSSMVTEESSSSDDSWKNNKGVGPITEVVFGDTIDEEMAEEGKGLYNIYCLACHKTNEDYIGPAPKDIFERRTPEWVANMIINPEEMLTKDPIAKELLVEYNNVPMASMGLDEDQTRKILEYFRTIE